MPIFRFHNEYLADSLKSSVIVHTKDDLLKVLSKHYHKRIKEVLIEEADEKFDKRCGWYTQHVSIKSANIDNRWCIVGMLSEPFKPEYRPKLFNYNPECDSCVSNESKFRRSVKVEEALKELWRYMDLITDPEWDYRLSFWRQKALDLIEEYRFD